MHVVIFGATGRVGKELVTLCLRNDYSVTAFARSIDKLSDLPSELTSRLDIIEGNVRVKEDVYRALSSKPDLVVSCLSTDKTDTLSVSSTHLIEGMKEFDLNRFIAVSTAGILRAKSEPSLYRFDSSESNRKTTRAAREHATVFEAFQATSINWTFFCPTYLPDGEATGSVMYELDFQPEGAKQITVGDTAAFVFEHLTNKEFFHKRVGIAEKAE
ncbi:NAD(P)H-binding protein [Paenalkalicoccus suaedae]|uniref:NAD(P)H-binding protein n=1 Tax=Paenalkalicoccus suaedae TaxID=2592382 RepID=A0A859FCR3_9BACI|nr:NAD(P)H-binding protein [Paenalkalicoccus suaedae]QKS70720.1 NAD(P)H-binding protein [Paenalkalicoccus suaedae]